MGETLKINMHQDIKDITQLLTDEDSEDDTKKKKPCLGRTLDGQTGYFIGGQVQTPDGQNHQGYGI